MHALKKNLKRFVTIAVVLSLVIAIGFLIGKSFSTKQTTSSSKEYSKAHSVQPVEPGKSDNYNTSSLTSSLGSRVPASDNLDKRITRYTDGTVDYHPSIDKSRMLYQTEKLPRADITIVSEIIADYRKLFETNPFGSENREITAGLLGKNPKNVIFLDVNHVDLSPEGELLDRWGSPFRFHPLTSSLMEVSSLGADRVLWTSDDLNIDLSEEADL
ncbi:MAG: hypothetical protein AAGA18_13530 [Verrucomicrobiota bacterium]